MFNLLPRAEKDAIRREYRTRLAVVALWGSCISLSLASLLLIPSYVLSSQKEKSSLLQRATLAKSVAANEAARFEETLKTVKARLSLVRANSSVSVRLFELIAKIAERRGEGISFEQMTLVYTSEGKRALVISGVAARRAALVLFERSLRESKLFEKVDLPISNLARDGDAEFTMSVSGF